MDNHNSSRRCVPFGGQALSQGFSKMISDPTRSVERHCQQTHAGNTKIRTNLKQEERKYKCHVDRDPSLFWDAEVSDSDHNFPWSGPSRNAVPYGMCFGRMHASPTGAHQPNMSMKRPRKTIRSRHISCNRKKYTLRRRCTTIVR